MCIHTCSTRVTETNAQYTEEEIFMMALVLDGVALIGDFVSLLLDGLSVWIEKPGPVPGHVEHRVNIESDWVLRTSEAPSQQVLGPVSIKEWLSP